MWRFFPLRAVRLSPWHTLEDPMMKVTEIVSKLLIVTLEIETAIKKTHANSAFQRRLARLLFRGRRGKTTSMRDVMT